MTLDEWKAIRCETWRNEQISKRAKILWYERGRPSGQDNQIWLDAEMDVKNSDEADAHHGPGGDW
jgi:hypothetical protein